MKRMYITINMGSYPERQKLGYKLTDHYAVYENLNESDNRKWVLTHLGTGMFICHCRTRSGARRCAEAFERIEGLGDVTDFETQFKNTDLEKQARQHFLELARHGLCDRYQ